MKAIDLIKERRYGKILIDRAFLDAIEYASFQKFFSQFIVLKAECDFPADRFIYTICGRKLRPVPAGEEIPQYDFWVTDNEKGEAEKFTLKSLTDFEINIEVL